MSDRNKNIFPLCYWLLGVNEGKWVFDKIIICTF